MKVAVFAPGFPAPSQTFVITHVVNLLDAGMDVTVLTTHAGDGWSNVPERVRDDVRERTIVVGGALLTTWKGAMRGLPSTDLVRAKLRHLRHRDADLGRYDVILAHFGHAGALALQLRRGGHIAGPIATVFHAWEISIRAMIDAWMPRYRQLFREGEALLPISGSWARRLEEWGADPAKIRVLHMGVDVPAGPGEVERPLHTPLSVLHVGRLVEKKAARDSIEAVRRCPSPVRLELIGTGPLDEALRALVASEPGASEVVFRGELPHPDVLAALDDADVLVLPSVTAVNGDVEGIPVVLMEAMARGCLVVSTVHSGIPELVDHGVSGLLVPEGSPGELAAALDAIATGRFDLAAMRRNAHDRVAREFNNASLANELVEVLEAVAAGRPLRG